MHNKNTQIVISEVMMPNKANVAGNIHGGEIIKMMDSTAYAAARRYSRANVVTARVDELEFHLPILIGDLVICTANIVFVGRTSMEIAVNVEVDDLEHEGGPQRALTAYFTMVALDRNAKPLALPPLVLETPEEKAAYEDAKRRYEAHKEKKRRLAEQRAQRKAANAAENLKKGIMGGEVTG